MKHSNAITAEDVEKAIAALPKTAEHRDALAWLQWCARPKARSKDAAHARVVLQMLEQGPAPAGGGK